MIINGLNLKDQNHCESQACLTVCQTIIFNIKKRASESSSSKPRHVAPREPPLPLYLGFNIHSLTRSKTLVTRLYQLGLSVSYDCVLEIEDLQHQSANSLRKITVCAPQIWGKGCFLLLLWIISIITWAQQQPPRRFMEPPLAFSSSRPRISRVIADLPWEFLLQETKSITFLSVMETYLLFL